MLSQLASGGGLIPLVGLGAALVACALVWTLALRRRRSGPVADGIEALIASGQLEGAGDALSERGRYAEAADVYRRANARSKLARAYLKLKQPEQAAEVYRELGRHAEAAHYFQTGGRFAEAAECLALLGDEREAAELFERAGDDGQAADLLRRLGDAESAARLYARAGRGAEAADALLAARGRTPKALLRAAELYEQVNDAARAADCYRECGEMRRAAELYETAGRHADAASAWTHERCWDRAAAAYLRDGALGEARTCYQRAGDRANEAQVAFDLGLWLDAAQGLYALGSYDRAIEALQRIPPDDAQARPGARLLGRIFTEKGLLDRAREQLEGLLGDGQPVEKDDLESLVGLADAFERAGDGLSALAVLERVCEIDEGFSDAALRLERLQERSWGTSQQTMAPLVENERYELRDEIGRGGMGIVHLAWDLELERPVAIKFLPHDLAQNSAAVKMFRGEARAAAAMNHPNIVHVYDVAVVGGQPCIVMEYVQGRSVREVMRGRAGSQRQPLPPKRVAEIGRDICFALAYAHTQNVIHRDVKPGNMLIASDGRVKLMDFGISKVLETGCEGLTQAKGTPQYMPPEQILGREIDGRTDLYALGISMFEMAVGRRPFRGENIVDQQLHDPVPDPRDHKPELEAGLAEIILRACAKKPGERFASAHQMAEALTGFLDAFVDAV